MLSREGHNFNFRSVVISVFLVWVLDNGAANTISVNQVVAHAKRPRTKGSLHDFCIEIRFDTIVSGHSTIERFIDNLKKQPTNIPGEDGDSEQVLNFDVDSHLSKRSYLFGLDKTRGQDHVIFLLRKEYQLLWGEIKQSYNDGEFQVVIMGTAGIGKSAFRFYVLRQWLLEDDLGFESVVFNAGEKYYRVDKRGKVVAYESQDELDVQSLCLIDPCSMLDKQTRVGFGLTIVTSSPSPFTGQQNKYSLSAFECYILVMKAWTVSEVRAVCARVEVQRIRDFSYQDEDGEQRCIPRWIIMNEERINKAIISSHQETSPAALRRLLMAPKSSARDPNLPYSLCRIEDRPNEGWAATGFISNYVAKYIHKWIFEDCALTIENFNQLPQNPFSHGFLGTIFEDWVQTGLGEKGRLLEVRLEDGTRNFQFRGAQSCAWRRNKKTGKVTFPHLHLENEVFNKLDGLESHSIDGYAIHSNTLVMIQPTISLTHSEAKLVAVEGLINAAKAKGVTSILMVYVVLVKNFEKFRAPACENLKAEGVKVCVGVIRDESDLLAKFSAEMF